MRYAENDRLSNVVGSKDDVDGDTGGDYVTFHQEDEGKMNKMPIDDCLEYKTELLQNGKYVKDVAPHSMEQTVRRMIADLRRKVVTDVPECGEFPIVYENIENPDKRMCLTDIMLKVTKPPKELKGTERERYLELVGYRLPSPYIAETVVGFGSKEDILKRLDEEALVEKIMERLPHLDEDLRDVPMPVE